MPFACVFCTLGALYSLLLEPHTRYVDSFFLYYWKKLIPKHVFVIVIPCSLEEGPDQMLSGEGTPYRNLADPGISCDLTNVAVISVSPKVGIVPAHSSIHIKVSEMCEEGTIKKILILVKLHLYPFAKFQSLLI